MTTTEHISMEHRVIDDLRRWFGKSLRIIVPIGCSVALLWWLFSKVDFRDMMAVLRHNVNYWWILLMMLFNAMSYVIRGVRWGMQLSAVGVKANVGTLIVSIFGAYALNLLFTGFGEAWRCIFISHREKASLSTVVGTDIGDRTTDGLTIVALLLLTMAVAGNALEAFVHQYAIGRDVKHFADNPWMWCGIVFAVGLIWSVSHFCRNYKFMDKVDGCFTRIWEGFRVLFTMRHKGLYLWLTIGIWVCYFMETYVCFSAFPFTEPLMSHHYAYGLLPALVALLFTSMSMGIPSSGGLGPWNLAMMFALSLYGIGRTDAAAFAMLLWGAQALTQILLGLYSIAYISATK